MINQQSISRSEFLDTLNSGAPVITGNKRLAVSVRQAFDQAALGKGLVVWPTPPVLPWSSWLQQTWEDAVVSGTVPAPALLLTAQQEQRVWEDIISASLVDQPLQQVTGTVRRAQEAWQLLQSWRVPLDAAVFRYNDDSAAFWQWASRFEALCAARDWLSGARICDALLPAVAAGKYPVPDALLLLGFDELTPQQQVLLQALVAAGCEVRWLQLDAQLSRAVRTACVDARQEAGIMARWVRQRLAENPAAALGIVVPELATQRDIVTQALDRVLVPQVLQPGAQCSARPYNLSLGIPLSAYPVIDAALKLLGLLAPTVSLADAGTLLHSPFITGWPLESNARARLDARLRASGELNVTVKTLRYHAGKAQGEHACPVLAGLLDSWQHAVRECPRSDRAGHWSERFAGLLKAIGWPRGRPLSSDEYQAAEAWRDLLSAFAALEPVTEPMTATAALAQLRRSAAQRTFQPQSAAPVPVQVLGVLEASGLQFDGLWIMGLHDGIWPAAPRPNPFIPLPVQRNAGLPHASEERELTVARIMTRRMLASAEQVVVSYPERSGDEELRPSPLISHLPLEPSDSLSLWPATHWRDDVYRSARITTLQHDAAPPLASAETRGGSTVFKLQAACPFHAFAELRLGARPLGQAELGLDAMTRGSLVHRVLEKIWRDLQDHERLCAVEDTVLQVQVDAAVDSAIDEIAPHYPQTLTGRFRALEAARLSRQVLAWLALERQREPFRVLEQEQQHQANVGGVQVSLKIDRIDALPDGRNIVIDYKTGDVSPGKWFGERPDEPQLPLYSMAVGDHVAGLVFAQVRAGSMAFNGVTAAEGLVPGVKSWEKLSQTRTQLSWSAVLADWRATMERLGEAYRHGMSEVDPRRNPDACTHCELGPLCRINELTLLDGADDPEASA